MTLSLALSCAAMAAAAETTYVPREILVKFRPASAGMADIYHNSIGAKKIGEIPQLGWQRLLLPSSVSPAKAVSYYRSLGAVMSAERNGYFAAHASVNDPMYGQQYSPGRMRVDIGWDLTTGNDKVVIAVLDSGVDYNHQDLAGKVTKGHDYADGDEDPMDEADHGTHVAGIAAAKTNNGVGIAGMGYNASILAIRVLDANGLGQWDWIANGIVEAADKKADIINMSLGGGAAPQIVEDAVNYAWNKGSVLLASTGNDGVTSKNYPAAYEKVIAVASSDRNDLRSDFSNYGADWADVAAPGTAILSTIPGNQYASFDGTSMASPNASGVAALIISYGEKGVITNQQVREVLENTAVRVGNWVAKGRVDAYAAIQNAVRPVIVTRGPETAGMFDGSSFSGTAQSLWANDNSRFVVNSRWVNQLGGVAGAEMSYAYTSTAKQYMRGSITVRSSGSVGTTATVYIKRNDGAYILLKSFPVSGTEVTQTVNLPTSITPYLSNSRLSFVVRGVRPARYGANTFAYSMNSAMLETRTSASLQP